MFAVCSRLMVGVNKAAVCARVLSEGGGLVENEPCSFYTSRRSSLRLCCRIVRFVPVLGRSQWRKWRQGSVLAFAYESTN